MAAKRPKLEPMQPDDEQIAREEIEGYYTAQMETAHAELAKAQAAFDSAMAKAYPIWTCGRSNCTPAASTRSTTTSSPAAPSTVRRTSRPRRAARRCPAGCATRATRSSTRGARDGRHRDPWQRDRPLRVHGADRMLPRRTVRARRTRRSRHTAHRGARALRGRAADRRLRGQWRLPDGTRTPHDSLRRWAADPAAG